MILIQILEVKTYIVFVMIHLMRLSDWIMIGNLKLIDSHLMSYMISHWIKMRIYFWKFFFFFKIIT
jgi:hypothetical protein